MSLVAEASLAEDDLDGNKPLENTAEGWLVGCASYVRPGEDGPASTEDGEDDRTAVRRRERA